MFTFEKIVKGTEEDKLTIFLVRVMHIDFTLSMGAGEG